MINFTDGLMDRLIDKPEEQNVLHAEWAQKYKGKCNIFFIFFAWYNEIVNYVFVFFFIFQLCFF